MWLKTKNLNYPLNSPQGFFRLFQQALYIFFLPKYCSEMNKIELEWQQFKKHEISGQMFEDEIDLAYTVIDGIDARGNEIITVQNILNLTIIPPLNIALHILVFPRLST